MANVSYLRPGAEDERSARKLHQRLTRSNGKSVGRGPYFIAAGVAVVAVLAIAVISLLTSSASLNSDSRALARIGMPLGGGTIESVSVTKVPENQSIPVELRGDQIWPRKLIRAGTRLSVYVVVKRPGWISWLAGKTQHVHEVLTAPTTSLQTEYLTLRSGAPVGLHFSQPVQMVSYGQPGALHRHLLTSGESEVDLPRTGPAGSELVAAAPRTWETAIASPISWFPAGTAHASAVASPAPGTKLGSYTPITLTLSKPVAKALGGHMPPVPSGTTGSWHTVNTHAIQFVPSGYGYGLGATVTVPLPNGVQLVGGQNGSVATWTVPAGSTLRLQQLLSLLGYLPLKFNYAGGSGVALTPQAQEQAAIDPPAGKFIWRYGNTPSALQSFWQPGTSGTMTQGAIMAFENTEGMDTDGIASAAVWKALIAADVSGKVNTFGYTFVSVSEGSPESESTWHNGKTVVSGPVNTGVPAAPTAQGLFAVFEHALSVTMSGTNPDGSHYDDPGVPYVSYFNGGDALHGFIRASYGFPQSDGCVEMPYSEASSVYPYTPIGTLVNVT